MTESQKQVSQTQGTPRLIVRGIKKHFPGVRAVDGVDLTLMPGEIHALLGENGAGKSTLMKIIYGLLQADEGTIQWEGAPVAFTDPAAARAAGIGMVFQHFVLFETLTVTENIALALPEGRVGESLADEILELSKRYGLALDPNRAVHALSSGERQRVEIIRCLLQDPRLLILDEPTSVLTPQEADALFVTLRRLVSEGRTILYISHKLPEIQALCDRATILRAGKVVDSCDPRTTSPAMMAEKMVGKVDRPTRRATHLKADAPVRFSVQNLARKADDPLGIDLKNISFSLRAGEILGVAGLAGSGQSELLAALGGEVLVAPDVIRLDNQPIGALPVAARRSVGLSYVPEERLGRSAVPDLDLTANSILSGWQRPELVAGGWLKRGAMKAFAEKIIADYRVMPPTAGSLARRLSGGNLQKFIMGREILANPKVLIVAAPTWGVDAGAAAAIHRALLALAEAGTAVLVISQDLDELFTLCDRMAALFHGGLSLAVPTAELSQETVGLMMGGVADAA
ncbi:ABC transporter ATP-binding protein [Elstera sp.]|uniref:ABC transporter ATP-binding protein n=1 Tax=Elstera sp. TaxID=1916664 RepID=UPI0037BF96A9